MEVVAIVAAEMEGGMTVERGAEATVRVGVEMVVLEKGEEEMAVEETEGVAMVVAEQAAKEMEVEVRVGGETVVKEEAVEEKAGVEMQGAGIAAEKAVKEMEEAGRGWW